MASNYTPNEWVLHNPDIPNEQQPDSFITKKKLDKMEKGIEEANIELEVGDVSIGENYGAKIIEDEQNKTRKLNIIFPPSGQGPSGEDGKSAYEIWLDIGNSGTEQDFFESLKGVDGKNGKDGKDGAAGSIGPRGESAYQIWLNNGNTGSESDFLNSIKGQQGEQGLQGETGDTGPQGPKGEQGEVGPQGPQGNTGEQGDTGKSAYEIWLEVGNTGTEQDFLNSLKGQEGDSAYEIWKSISGNENKTITEFFEYLKGEKGDPGTGSSSSVEFVDFGG